jgi:hypothetical protein
VKVEQYIFVQSKISKDFSVIELAMKNVARADYFNANYFFCRVYLLPVIDDKRQEGAKNTNEALDDAGMSKRYDNRT